MRNKSYCYFLYIIISIIDLYINYNEQYFPEYHEKRVKYDIICLFIYLAPIFLIISALFGSCCLFLCSLFLIIIYISGFYYLIISFYLYFAYDGSNKIKNPVIRIFLWITFLTFIIGIFSGCFGSNSGNRRSHYHEIEEQNYYYLLN